MITDARTVEEALQRVSGADVAATRGVSGGCIANGSRVELVNGDVWFVKRSRTLPPDLFAAEAAGLRALSAAPGPRVPEVVAVHASSAESFIVMEWVEQGSRGRGFAEEFGRALARMHRHRSSDRFGFERDNYIGATPQPNAWMDSWYDFFRERRIGYQTSLARDSGLIHADDVRDLEAIMGRIESILPEPDRPSLLHGDLWGGNYLVDSGGNAVLIDPAAYYGHREADLAMTELFGGFSSGFYSAYDREWPLEPGYRGRASLYNLYHMLNHANLFGQSYVSGVRRIVRTYR